MIDAAEIRDRLRAHCRGKQSALAFEAGVSEPFVSKVLSGDYPPGPKLLSLIGYRRVTAYEPCDSGSGAQREARRAEAEGPQSGGSEASASPKLSHHPLGEAA